MTQASVTIPYVGNTPKSQRYSFGATLFANGNTYFYPVYTTAVGNAAFSDLTQPIPVTLLPSNNAALLNGVVATSTAKTAGISLQVGRRMTDSLLAQVGINAENVTNSTVVPSPYFFQTNQPNIIIGPTPGPLSNLTSNTGSFGIQALRRLPTSTRGRRTG